MSIALLAIIVAFGVLVVLDAAWHSDGGERVRKSVLERRRRYAGPHWVPKEAEA